MNEGVIQLHCSCEVSIFHRRDDRYKDQVTVCVCCAVWYEVMVLCYTNYVTHGILYHYRMPYSRD